HHARGGDVPPRAPGGGGRLRHGPRRVRGLRPLPPAHARLPGLLPQPARGRVPDARREHVGRQAAHAADVAAGAPASAPPRPARRPAPPGLRRGRPVLEGLLRARPRRAPGPAVAEGGAAAGAARGGRAPAPRPSVVPTARQGQRDEGIQATRAGRGARPGMASPRQGLLGPAQAPAGGGGADGGPPPHRAPQPAVRLRPRAARGPLLHRGLPRPPRPRREGVRVRDQGRRLHPPVRRRPRDAERGARRRRGEPRGHPHRRPQPRRPPPLGALRLHPLQPDAPPHLRLPRGPGHAPPHAQARRRAPGDVPRHHERGAGADLVLGLHPRLGAAAVRGGLPARSRRGERLRQRARRAGLPAGDGRRGADAGGAGPVRPVLPRHRRCPGRETPGRRMKALVPARVRRAVRRLKERWTPRGLILMYHRVGAGGADPWGLRVSPEHFAEHLDVLTRRGSPMALSGLAEAVDRGRLPRRAVAVTFDDGYADNLHAAVPLLERHDVPATVFLTTGYLGGQREFWWDALEQVLLHDAPLPACLRVTVGGEPFAWASEGEGAGGHAPASQGWRCWEEPPTERQALYLALWQRLQKQPEAERWAVLDGLARWAGVSLTVRPDLRALT